MSVSPTSVPAMSREAERIHRIAPQVHSCRFQLSSGFVPVVKSAGRPDFDAHSWFGSEGVPARSSRPWCISQARGQLVVAQDAGFAVKVTAAKAQVPESVSCFVSTFPCARNIRSLPGSCTYWIASSWAAV